MSTQGIGQGLAQGVQMLAPMVMSKIRMDRQNQQFYDQLAVRSGWQDGRMGQVGMAQEPAQDPSGVDQTSQVGRLAVPGRPIATPQAEPTPALSPGMALGMQGNHAPRMPNPVSVRGGRRLF